MGDGGDQGLTPSPPERPSKLPVHSEFLPKMRKILWNWDQERQEGKDGRSPTELWQPWLSLFGDKPNRAKNNPKKIKINSPFLILEWWKPRPEKSNNEFCFIPEFPGGNVVIHVRVHPPDRKLNAPGPAPQTAWHWFRYSTGQSLSLGEKKN